jgi:hypothetical protein
MCPNNPVGQVDAFLVSHHGMDISNSPALVHGIGPRVAILNNGAKKGGSPAAWQVVRNSPALEDIWQLHHAVAAGSGSNAPEQFIANMEPACEGHSLKLTAEPGGGFTVSNARNGFRKTYPARN